MMTRPDRTEAADYYFNYINQVPDGDIRDTLDLFGSVSDEQSLHRYAEGKATIRAVANHLSDTALPNFDQQVASSASTALRDQYLPTL